MKQTKKQNIKEYPAVLYTVCQISYDIHWKETNNKQRKQYPAKYSASNHIKPSAVRKKHTFFIRPLKKFFFSCVLSD